MLLLRFAALAVDGARRLLGRGHVVRAPAPSWPSPPRRAATPEPTAASPRRCSAALGGRVAPVGVGAGAIALAVVGDGGPGALAVVGGFAAAPASWCSARRRLGGFTGDVLGAAGVVGETVGLVVAAARW